MAYYFKPRILRWDLRHFCLYERTNTDHALAGDKVGKYFVMSMRFNKCSASDFGLVPCGKDRAIDPNDGSAWIKSSLYDFGWGKESGYYKSPLPEFPELVELVLHSANEEDVFGAAATVLEKYPDQLLEQCEMLMDNQGQKDNFNKMARIFKLNFAVNRSSTANKSCDQIKNDYERWRKVSEAAKKR